jgi:hypothetical protein
MRSMSVAPGVPSGTPAAKGDAAGAIDHVVEQLRTLQIAEDADRAVEFLLDRADAPDELAHELGAGMARIDTEHIGAGPKQARDHLRGGRKTQEQE